MSQWKPAGFWRGNSVPWAIREETGLVDAWVSGFGGGERFFVGGGGKGGGGRLTVVVEVEEDG